MNVLDASTDGVDKLRVFAPSVRPKVSTARYSWRQAASGEIPRRDDRRSDSGTACVSVSPGERRSARRHAQQLPLIMSIFNRDDLFSAQMLNYSQDGVCVETGQRILPGTSLHLRIDASPAAAVGGVACHCFRTTSLGEVKWCQARGQDHLPRYIIGIRFYHHY